MSMTREKAIKFAEHAVNMTDIPDVKEFYGLAAAALRFPTREMVERMRGEWIIEDAGKGDRRKKCSLCDTPISGWWGRDKFCAECGAPMTDEAVDMMLEKWKEAVVDEA